MSDREYEIERNRLLKAYMDKHIEHIDELMECLKELGDAKIAGVSLAQFEAQVQAKLGEVI